VAQGRSVVPEESTQYNLGVELKPDMVNPISEPGEPVQAEGLHAVKEEVEPKTLVEAKVRVKGVPSL
jgi:hypothetical protein